MQVQWNDHTIKISGSWAGRWLYLAPDYELWIDDQKLDRRGGPQLQPRLEAIYEDDDGKLHHIQARLLSVAGFRPRCELTIEGETIAVEKVRVQNFLNPFLLLIIVLSTLIMIAVGPEVIQRYLNLR